MKLLKVLSLIVIMTVFFNPTVSAKDTLYSLNKYPEEEFTYLKKSYNSNNQIDGYVVAGTYLQENKKISNTSYIRDTEIILRKYNLKGGVVWDYTYGNNYNDAIDYLSYTYNETNQIDGYLISLMKPNEEKEAENPPKENLLIKIDLEGKEVLKKELNLENYARINKIIKTNSNDNTKYLALVELTTEDNKSVILGLDKNLNETFRKNANDSNNYIDIVEVKNNETFNYVVLSEQTLPDEKKISIQSIDITGNAIREKIELDQIETAALINSKEGFILYGLTKEVKLKDGELTYYLINYDSEYNELWETVGEEAVAEEPIKLLNSTQKEKNNYFLLSKNNTDKAIEVTKFDEEGLFIEKIKKLNNDYYTINNFDYYKEVLYFVGNITCPEDETCDYKTNSLFLISNKDKVIEVKKDTSINIILVLSVVIILIVFFILLRKKRRAN